MPLTVWLILQEQEEKIRMLNAQINTQNELKRIRKEIQNIEEERNK